MEGTVGYPSMPEERATPQPAAPPSDILLPAPQLMVPAARETQFPIRHTDWLRLRRMIERLSDPSPNLANVGWACVGIASSAITAYFPWAAADSQLPIKAQQHYSYVSPLLASVAVSSILIALFIFFTKKRLAKVRSTSLEDILVDMDSICEPQRQQPESSGLSNTESELCIAGLAIASFISQRVILQLAGEIGDRSGGQVPVAGGHQGPDHCP
jgi:hypothetical protein